VHLLQTFLQLGHRPHEEWLQSAMTEAARAPVRLSVPRLADLLVALAKLGAPPADDWLQAMLQAVGVKMVSHASPSALARLAWALSRLQAPVPAGGWLR